MANSIPFSSALQTITDYVNIPVNKRNALIAKPLLSCYENMKIPLLDLASLVSGVVAIPFLTITALFSSLYALSQGEFTQFLTAFTISALTPFYTPFAAGWDFVTSFPVDLITAVSRSCGCTQKAETHSLENDDDDVEMIDDHVLA